MAKIVTIATFTLPTQLSIVKGRLETEGIKCFVKDELTVQTNNFYSNAIGGIKLQVFVYDFDEATRILTELGYLKQDDFQKDSFWNKMDRLTNKTPLLKRVRIELRLLIILGISVFFIITLLYFLFSPTKYELLVSNNWQLEYITYDGKNYKPNPYITIIMVTGERVTNLSFMENGNIIFPGFNTNDICGKWELENGKLIVSDIDTLDYIFEGKFNIDFQDRSLILTSNKTVIYCNQLDIFSFE